jgi:hypothetical protein
LNKPIKVDFRRKGGFLVDGTEGKTGPDWNQLLPALLDRCDAVAEELKVECRIDVSKNPEALRAALHFARKLPGFQIEVSKKRGKPTDWGDMRLFYLWWDVEEIRRKGKSVSVLAACNRLVKDNSWTTTMKARTFTSATLKRRYFAAKISPFVVTIEKTIAEFDVDAVRTHLSGLLTPNVRAELSNY